MREGSRTSLPSPPLLFIAFSTPHRSPLSERLEQAKPVQVMGSWLVLINLTRKNQVQYYFDLFSTKTDQHQFSPNNVNTESGEKVMRIIDMITQGKML